LDSSLTFDCRDIKETSTPTRWNSYESDFKAKATIKPLKSDKSTAEFDQIGTVRPAQISTWKKQLAENVETIVEAKDTKSDETAVKQ
jgi:hypothetical protein